MIDKFVFFDRPLLASDADRNICLIEYLFGNLPIVMLKKIAPFRPDVGQILLMEVFEEIWGVKYFQKLLENFDKSYWSKKAESKYTEFLQAFNLDISTVLTQEDTEKLLDLLDM